MRLYSHTILIQPRSLLRTRIVRETMTPKGPATMIPQPHKRTSNPSCRQIRTSEMALTSLSNGPSNTNRLTIRRPRRLRPPPRAARPQKTPVSMHPTRSQQCPLLKRATIFPNCIHSKSRISMNNLLTLGATYTPDFVCVEITCITSYAWANRFSSCSPRTRGASYQKGAFTTGALSPQTTSNIWPCTPAWWMPQT